MFQFLFTNCIIMYCMSTFKMRCDFWGIRRFLKGMELHEGGQCASLKYGLSIVFCIVDIVISYWDS